MVVGFGIGLICIGIVLGIFKVYIIWVGFGLFFIELFDEYGEYLFKIGCEFGVIIGWCWCCGWFDVVIVCYVVWVNGIIDYFLIKFDVLFSLELVLVCVGYEIDGWCICDMLMI